MPRAENARIKKLIMDAKIMEYIFTFGYGQPNKGCFHVITAESKQAAREKMVERFVKNGQCSTKAERQPVCTFSI
jgi:hypothetical protein